MTNHPQHPRHAIRAHLAGDLDGQSLFRALMSHKEWHIPTRTDAGGEAALVSFVAADGARWMKFFTDAEAVQTWSAAEGGDLADQCIVTVGYSIFGILEDDLAGVEINPSLQDAVHYVQEQIPQLRQWANSIRVEEALATIDFEETPLGLLKDYTNYFLVLRRAGADSAHLVLAPDSQGRALAAVFTAEDALQFFLDAIAPSADFDPVPVRVNGEQLFAQLNELPLDGVVFNCSGPIQPRAYGKRLAEYVLSADREA
jgi:hypothetical protein